MLACIAPLNSRTTTSTHSAVASPVPKKLRPGRKAQQQHRPAAEAVGQRGQHRRAEEVGDGEGDGDRAIPEGLVAR
jgi:hypothetical protein